MEPAQFKYDRISDSTFVFEAKTPLVDFCKILEMEAEVFDEVRGESDSLGGLLLELEGRIPEKGTVIEMENLRFEVLDSDDRKIKDIRVIIGDN